MFRVMEPGRFERARLQFGAGGALGARLTFLFGLLLAMSALTGWYTGEGEGTTVELWSDGAVLRLTGLGPAESHIDVRLALPERSLFTAAKVVRREAPDLVEVSFRWIDTYERGRLRAFVDKLS